MTCITATIISSVHITLRMSCHSVNATVSHWWVDTKWPCSGDSPRRICSPNSCDTLPALWSVPVLTGSGMSTVFNLHTYIHIPERCVLNIQVEKTCLGGTNYPAFHAPSIRTANAFPKVATNHWTSRIKGFDTPSVITDPRLGSS
jgi:hypothetical protein